jgi:hypothetical protein
LGGFSSLEGFWGQGSAYQFFPRGLIPPLRVIFLRFFAQVKPWFVIFSNIVNHAIQEPLDIYFDLSPESKPVQSLVGSEVGKDRFGHLDSVHQASCSKTSPKSLKIPVIKKCYVIFLCFPRTLAGASSGEDKSEKNTTGLTLFRQSRYDPKLIKWLIIKAIKRISTILDQKI